MQVQHQLRWTPEEDAYLSELAPHATAQEIAAALGCTLNAVYNRARKLSITFRQWSDSEIEFLKTSSADATTTQLANFTGRSQVAVRRKLHTLGLSREAHIYRRHYAINDHAFDGWSEEATYWMGFIAADGCLTRSTALKSGIAVQLAERDIEHLERLRTYLKAEHPIKQRNGKAILRVSSPILFERLMQLGITPRKTHILTFPTLPLEYVTHFVRGYFDGDGSAGRAKDGSLFWNLLGTESFLLGVASRMPVAVTVRKRPDCNIYRIQTWGENATAILRWMYQDARVFLPRKREKIVNIQG